MRGLATFMLLATAFLMLNAQEGFSLEGSGVMFVYGEEFTYDNLDRLTSYTGQGGTKNITYEDNGNISSHTDLGNYEYSQVKPHAVETVGGLLPGLQSAEGSTFTYNGFGKVSSINFSGMSQMSWRRLDFSYGPDRERWKTVQTMRGGLIPGPITTLAISESSVYYVHTTNLYAGDYERIDGTSYYYLDGGVIYVKPATGAGQAYYALTDHLGSYVRLYTMAGDSVLIASYDPWGNRTTTKNTLKFHRGFTGHEHLTTYGVINMNGRMYDPTVGRFLAPDNFVQMPDFSQSFNRYSYCLNNPLKYTDPSGELLGVDDWLIVAIATGVFTGAMNAKMGGDNVWFGALVGGIIGGLSYGVGQWLSSASNAVGVWAGAASGAAGGSLVGGLGEATSTLVGNLINKRKWSERLWSSFVTGALSGAVSGAISGARNGYKEAVKQKYNPWSLESMDENSNKHYTTKVKDNIPTQPDPTKHCYSYAGEYANTGHNGLTANDYQLAAMKDGMIPDGAKFNEVSKNLGLTVDIVKKNSFNDLMMTGDGIVSGKIEGVLSIDTGGTFHAVNVVSYDLTMKHKPFGLYKTAPFIKNMRVWDPIDGVVKKVKSSSIINFFRIMF